jgi:Rrf2 family transcriptional regulator, iron-sulfur cluster assembly transcription factor
MKLSRAAAYAIHALVYLARQGGDRTVAVHAIAGGLRAAVPVLFLTKVLGRLARAGLVGSLKGPRGGSWLARPAADITLLEVIEAVDGPIRPVVDLTGGPEVEPLRQRLEAVYAQVTDLQRRQLGRVTVKDLAGATK